MAKFRDVFPYRSGLSYTPELQPVKQDPSRPLSPAETKRIISNAETFDPDKLIANELDQGNGIIIAKIPKIPGRISRRKKGDSNEYFIEFITERHYDKESQQTRNAKTIIGTDVSGFLRGMMIINDHYHKYFDRAGNLIHDPMKGQEEPEEEETREEAPVPAGEPIPQDPDERERGTEAMKANDNEPVTDPKAEPETKTDEPNQLPVITDADLLQREEAVREREEQALRKEEELNEAVQKLNELRRIVEDQRMQNIAREMQIETDHIRLLAQILDNHCDTIREQAKRRPNVPMTVGQVRIINELLSEIREYLAGCETEKYLKLAEEPAEEKEGENGEDHPGTTYCEMDLILDAYYYTLAASRSGSLWKRKK